MNEITIGILLLAGLLTMLDWRQGLVMCVVVGIAQDPLRKLAPGQPVYYVVLVGIIFGIAWIRAALVRVPLGPSVIRGWRQNLKAPFWLFLCLVIAQAFHTFVRYGSATMMGIGLLVWLAPIPAVVLAYQYASRRGVLGVRRWMLFYSVVALICLSGVYFEYIGLTWRTLGEIGEGQVIYDVGTVLKAHSGFFRASEIAAWHTATIACFVFILSLGKKPTLFRILFALGLIALLVSLGILTGRRKMLVEITIFISTYLFLVAWLQRGMARLGMAVLLMGFVGYVGIVGFIAPDLVQNSYSKSMTVENAQQIEGYAVRGQSVFADLPRRVNAVGLQPLVWAVENFGWFGAGLGTGSQGTNDIAEQHNINRWAAEGGLGKVAMELGIPGLLLAAWLVVALGRHLREQLAMVAKISPQHMRVAYGLVAFLVANAATFTVATQAYSDLFILLILGWCLGFLLAMPALAARGDGLKKKPAPRHRYDPLPPAGYRPSRPAVFPQASAQRKP
ncbi:hypothetical protein [Caenimonas aquaedulcis]|uniref:Uncharacterized protein n=1 Tax=Caenimonas aquaedulcis TaxID=2793270 RepID=A0A931MHS3_9BURK|nr:hypothetical protein [Caenimonas aquaedulcis]MBG9389059.1 hypothetical protein [Caenimonas aquaedulcis]